MRKTDCNICDQQDVPLNDTLKINGKVYCPKCLEAWYPRQEMLVNELIEYGKDPTVCQFCSKDFEDEILKKTGTYPVCTDCDLALKNKTFPLWVKGFFAAIIFIIVFSFFWNWEYYKAYNNVKQSWVFYEIGEFSKAEDEMKAAANAVPEVEALNTLHNYFKGIRLLYEGKSNDALSVLYMCKDSLPPEYEIDYLILEAKQATAFDKKDYNGFLAASMESLNIDSTSAMSFAKVASAHAAVYASEGNDKSMDDANTFLYKAKRMDSVSAEMKHYLNRIEHRIATRKIIDSDEFTKTYPNGWAQN